MFKESAENLHILASFTFLVNFIHFNHTRIVQLIWFILVNFTYFSQVSLCGYF